ncbi:MAG: hypothetical protein HRT90_00540 [Candidatus Margulisbacteria bacterium]|nr:hypothetical protein [Candidatus Margulisiibacteriota bacterium]
MKLLNLFLELIGIQSDKTDFKAKESRLKHKTLRLLGYLSESDQKAIKALNIPHIRFSFESDRDTFLKKLSSKKKPDLILVNHQSKNPIDLLRHIQDKIPGEDTHIILIANHLKRHLILELLKMRVSCFWVPPLTKARFISIIESLFESYNQSSNV